MSAVRIAIFQAQSGIDPAANAARLVAAVREAAAGGAAMLFTPEMSGMLDRDRERALGKARREDGGRGARRGARGRGARRGSGCIWARWRCAARAASWSIAGS